MKAREQYATPEVEIFEIMVEGGFGNSIEDPVENEEIEW